MNRSSTARIDVSLMTFAEKIITDAIREVEYVGAHQLLTDCVSLLMQARDKLADYEDARQINEVVGEQPTTNVCQNAIDRDC